VLARNSINSLLVFFSRSFGINLNALQSDLFSELPVEPWCVVKVTVVVRRCNAATPIPHRVADATGGI